MVGRFLCGTMAFASTVDAICMGNRAPFVFRDMHDGDMKQIIAVDTMTAQRFVIQPYNGSSTTDEWIVQGEFDFNCQAVVDFNVPGKPSPPPVNLTMSLWIMGSTDDKLTRLGLEFTDPSSSLAPAAAPLNLWVLDHWPQTSGPTDSFGARGVRPADVGVERQTCISTPRFKSDIVFDMHDGDQKSLKVSRDSLTITPFEKEESWTVKAKFDTECVASVDFNVAGKPNPPPVPLEARVWGMTSTSLDGDVPDKKALLFSDPSGTVGPANAVLNSWLEGNVDPSSLV